MTADDSNSASTPVVADQSRVAEMPAPPGKADAIKAQPVPAAKPQQPAVVGASKAPGRSYRWLLLIAVLGIIAASGGYAWWRIHTIAVVGPLMLDGNVEVREVNLGFKVAGRIAKLNVDEGDAVAAGQTMASLDKVYFENSLTQLRAQRDQVAAALAKAVAGNRPEDIAQAAALVSQDQAGLQIAQQTLDRATELLKSGAGARSTYDSAIATQRQAAAQLNSAQAALHLMQIGNRKEDIDAARAQLANAEAAITIAERDLADSDLKAPNTGVVLTRVAEAGAIVNAGTTAFVVSLISPVWVRTYVDEENLTRIKPGMVVNVQVDAPGVAALKGRIGFISSTAEFTPKTVETIALRTALVYRLRVVVDDPEGHLRQGMPVTVAVPAPSAPSP